MAVQFVDAVAGKTTTTGTGTYTITANVAGFRDFAQIADGVQCVCVIRSATDLEVGLYTKGGGASPTMARTTVYRNLAGTTSAVSWAAGEKDIRTTLSREILPATIANNIWLADQYMRTARIAFGSNDASYFYSDIDDNIVGVLGSLEFLRMVDGSPPSMRIRWTDAGTGSGPTFRLDRNSSTPAINDFLGQILFDGRDSGGGNQTYGKIQCQTRIVTAGSESGLINITVPVLGTDEVIMSFSGNDIIAMPGIQNAARVFMVGKNTQGIVNTGTEILSTGTVAITTDNTSPMLINRKNGNGIFLEFRRDNVTIGQITTTDGTNVLYQPFVGSHITSIADNEPLPEVGTLLSTVDERHDDVHWHLPKVKVTDQQGCRRVYGVYAGLSEGTAATASVGAYKVLVTGTCVAGDLLWASDIPGIAEVQPDDIVRAHTVGKVTISDDRTDVRLIPAAIYCG